MDCSKRLKHIERAQLWLFGDVWELISLFSTERHIVKMGERCPAMYVTVSVIVRVMMKRQCL